MSILSTPEGRALLVVFLVVLASSVSQTVYRGFDRLEAVDARASQAISTAQELQEKVEELVSQIEELQSELAERR